MEISLNTTYYETSNIKKNTLKANKELKSDTITTTNTDITNNNIIQEKTDTQQLNNNIKNFVNLCKQFPDIAFIVMDYAGGPLPEYNGICNTSIFGALDKVSIMIDEKVIEQFDEDFDNITNKIQYISDNYEKYKSNAEMSNCHYTANQLYYEGGKLGIIQILLPGSEPPNRWRETGSLEPSSRDDTTNDTKEKYFQNLILNMQYDSYNKLFEIGKEDNENEREDEKNYKAKAEAEQKYIAQYQKSFLYKQ